MRILYDPEPRRTEDIFLPADKARFLAEHEVAEWRGEPRPAFYARHLAEAEIVISQQPMPAETLAAAPHLRAIFNVETNFLPNIDYETCFRRGIHVLAPSGVFATAVAEMGLGMALSLARNIHEAHGDFRAGHEHWGLVGNQQAELLTGATMGIIGYGDLGRALAGLLAAFRPRLLVHDPWLPQGQLRRAGLEPCDLDTLMAEARVIFITASATEDNRHMIGAEALARMQPGAMLVLLSRAAVLDFAALAEALRAGRIRAATDVFPEEPLAADDPIRRLPGLLLSAHRAGALTSALQEIGSRVLDDLDLIGRGLPPQACRRAERETVARLRSMPVRAT